jgi:hypothetical protein
MIIMLAMRPRKLRKDGGTLTEENKRDSLEELWAAAYPDGIGANGYALGCGPNGRRPPNLEELEELIATRYAPVPEERTNCAIGMGGTTFVSRDFYNKNKKAIDENMAADTPFFTVGDKITDPIIRGSHEEYIGVKQDIKEDENLKQEKNWTPVIPEAERVMKFCAIIFPESRPTNALFDRVLTALRQDSANDWRHVTLPTAPIPLSKKIKWGLLGFVLCATLVLAFKGEVIYILQEIFYTDYIG